MPNSEAQNRAAEKFHDSRREFVLKMSEASVKTGDAVLKSSTIINGGACAALIAFMGALVSSNKISPAELTTLAYTLTWFACGVAYSALGLGSAFLANFGTWHMLSNEEPAWQFPYYKRTSRSRRWRRVVRVSQALGVLFGTASIGTFLWGIKQTCAAVSHLTFNLPLPP